ncbi:MAG: hypothetical protein ACM3SM_08390 [Bacteroidota bacterium]
MNKVIQKVFLFVVLFTGSAIFAQTSDPTSTIRFMGKHTGNRIGITFYDDGQVAGYNVGTDIRGEWPYGSGENYIGDCIPLIGVEFTNRRNRTLQSVIISRGPRSRQAEEKHPVLGYFWGWNPRPGFRNDNYESVAMSHLPDSYPLAGWNDPIAANWKDIKGKTQWYGYFGRDIKNADQESLFEADDQWDDEFNFTYNTSGGIVDTLFLPDSRNTSRHGMGLKMRVRGFQWASFLAEDAIFWLYDITNESNTIYRKADFGTVVGTLAGGDGDSGDDLGDFVADEWITYSYDNPPGIGNHGQKVGYVGYAFLESPGNPYDGIDNDNDSQDPASPRFTSADFDSVKYDAGQTVILIDPVTYTRTEHIVKSTTDTVYSMGKRFVIVPGKTYFREGHIARIQNGVSIPDVTAYDGYDNDLDGLIDENRAVHYLERTIGGVPVLQKALKHKDYQNKLGLNDPLIDEERDNNIDEDGDWDPLYDDVGIDGLGPQDANYPGKDIGEGNGIPDQGEPNFGKTDPHESDQIGLTSFNFFNQSASPDMRSDSTLWARMTPGRFDVIPPIPQDGDFIYASGYFPLVPQNGNLDKKERFSVSLLFGEDYNDIVANKKIVQKIYNQGYKFPQAPAKPELTVTQDNGKVVLYWNGELTESSVDFITKKKDFQGYKIYRATDAEFADSRTITNGQGVLSFDKPLVQYDRNDSVKGYFYPSPELLNSLGGTTFYLGDNTGIVNRYIDSNVVKGQTYYYAVCAYDDGDASQDIFPTENPKFIRKDDNGQIVTDLNTGYITPGARPVGYKDAKESELVKSEGFIGTGAVEIEVIDDHAIKDGYKYQIAFKDTGVSEYTSNWSLLDLQTPDTVYVPSIKETYIVKPMESITLPSGTDTIYVNERAYALRGATTYTAPYDSLINNSTMFLGSTPIRDGFRVQLYNVPSIKVNTDTSKTGFINKPASDTLTYNFTVLKDPSFPVNNGVERGHDYRIDFYDHTVATSTADTLKSRNPRGDIYPATDVNFKVIDVTTNKEIKFTYKRIATPITTSYMIIFREDMDGVLRRTWRVDLNYNKGNADLLKSGSLRLSTVKPFNGNDKITFTMKGAEIDQSLAKSQLDQIKVVPNPYIVTHQAEAKLSSTQVSGRGEREIRFTHIPPNSKITIFTVRGERIKELTHDDLYVGDVYWNLRTEENIDVAFGVYVYVVEAPGIPTKIGKFALIK